MDDDIFPRGGFVLSRRDMLRIMAAASQANSPEGLRAAVSVVKAVSGSLDSPVTAEDFISPVAREIFRRDWRDHFLVWFKAIHWSMDGVDSINPASFTLDNLESLFDGLGPMQPEYREGVVKFARHFFSWTDSGLVNFLNKRDALTAQL